MLINILLIILAIPLIILPTLELINKEENKWYRKLTKYGIMFYIAIFLVAILQVIKEKQSSKNETILIDSSHELKSTVETLTKIGLSNSDTINFLKGIVISIENQLYSTDKSVNNLVKTRDSLNQRLFEYERPVIHLTSAKIIEDKYSKQKYMILFTFMSDTKSSATNVFGKCYTMHGDTLWDNGTLSINRTDVFTYNKGFSFGRPINFNPDSTSLLSPYYYYFNLSYSDLFLQNSYHYEVAMVLSPFNKGDFKTELGTCRDWERVKIKNRVDEYNKHK